MAVAFGFGDGDGTGAAVNTGSAVHVDDSSTPDGAPPPGWVRMAITSATSSGTLMVSRAILPTETALCVASGGLPSFDAGEDMGAANPHGEYINADVTACRPVCQNRTTAVNYGH